MVRNTQLIEIDACTDALTRYTIKTTYPATLKCMLSDLLEEFKIWLALNKSWLSFKDTKPKSNITEMFSFS